MLLGLLGFGRALKPKPSAPEGVRLCVGMGLFVSGSVNDPPPPNEPWKELLLEGVLGAVALVPVLGPKERTMAVSNRLTLKGSNVSSFLKSESVGVFLVTEEEEEA